MNKINKGLLFGNVMLLLVLLAMVFTACSSSGQIKALQTKDIALETLVQQLQAKVDSQAGVISQLQAQSVADKAWIQGNFDILFNAINTK